MKVRGGDPVAKRTAGADHDRLPDDRSRVSQTPVSAGESASPSRQSAASLLDFDYKAEKFTDGWSWNPGSNDFEPRQGIIVRWRLKGERRWTKQTVYCDQEQDQTPDSLAEQLPEIVAALAQRAGL